MRSDVFNERQEIAKIRYLKYLCLVKSSWLNLLLQSKFLYTWNSETNFLADQKIFKFSFPVSSNKVKKILKRKGSFDIFVKFYDQIEQFFKTALKFM